MPTMDLTGERAAKAVHSATARARAHVVAPAALPAKVARPRPPGAAPTPRQPEDYQKVEELKKPPGYE